MNGLINLLIAGILGITPNLALENTNIIGYQEINHTTDFNRLRADLSLDYSEAPNLFAKLIVDNKSEYITTPEHFKNKTSVYRAYLQYRGDTHFWTIGKQRIPLGVGRIWNPIDKFNPIQIEQVEPANRQGVDAIRYEYAHSQFSVIDVTLAQDQGAIRAKTNLQQIDIGLICTWDDDTDIDIIGWEVEGELLQTGIEFRSEGGRFHNHSTDDHYFSYIIGAEYGFANSINFLTEYHYDGELEADYLAGQLSLQPAMLWYYSCLVTNKLGEKSGFINPTVEYSFSDNTTIGTGAFIYYGHEESAFSQPPDQYYLRLFIHF